MPNMFAKQVPDTYSLPVHCTNCDYKSDKNFPKGKAVNLKDWCDKCPNCGCETLRRTWL